MTERTTSTKQLRFNSNTDLLIEKPDKATLALRRAKTIGSTPPGMKSSIKLKKPSTAGIASPGEFTPTAVLPTPRSDVESLDPYNDDSPGIQYDRLSRVKINTPLKITKPDNLRARNDLTEGQSRVISSAAPSTGKPNFVTPPLGQSGVIG